MYACNQLYINTPSFIIYKLIVLITFLSLFMEILPLPPIFLPHFHVKTFLFNQKLITSSSFLRKQKDKVVFILGSTGTGKSKLAIELATHFSGEVVNSDKMQVYDGLSIITNKVNSQECAGIPHHLIGGVHPDSDYTAADFCREATQAVESVIARGHLPIIAGGSNSYIEELVDGKGGKFQSRYECCFIWIDVELPVLHSYVSDRVDKMVQSGLVEEAHSMFKMNGDYSKGVRRSIGVSEMDKYFRVCESVDNEMREKLLKEAIFEIKDSTCRLSCVQLKKINRLAVLPGWDVCRVDATEAFREICEETWSRVAREPSIKIVRMFMNKGTSMISCDLGVDDVKKHDGEHKGCVAVGGTC